MVFHRPGRQRRAGCKTPQGNGVQVDAGKKHIRRYVAQGDVANGAFPVTRGAHPELAVPRQDAVKGAFTLTRLSNDCQSQRALGTRVRTELLGK